MFERGRISCVLVVFIVYLLYLSVFTLSPFTITFDPSRSLLDLVAQKFDVHSVFWRIPFWDIFSNILLFIPFGFLFVSLPGVRTYRFVGKLFLAGATVCLVSLSLEVAQLFLPRFPSVVDVVLNVVGGITGALISMWLYAPISRSVYRWWLNLQASPMLLGFLVMYIIGLLGVHTVPFHLGQKFSNWDPNFTLQIGNEGTLDRPWLGSMFLLAMYDRALSRQEVLTNWMAGSVSITMQTRVEEGLVVYYDFTKGGGTVVHDRSSWDMPLDLQIRDMDHIKWLHPNGIELLTNTIISSLEPASKIFESNLRKRSALTLEVWISPAHIDQKGPARIVSYSADSEARNLTLGQAKRNIVSRIRTPVSGPNGTRPQLQTKDDLLTADIQHVLITYRDGLETLYVNGQVHSTLAFDDRTYLLRVFEAFLGWKYLWIYWFVVLSPLGILSYLFFAQNRGHSGNAVWLSCGVGVIVLAVMEWIPKIMHENEIDVIPFLIGSAIVLLSVLTTAILDKAVHAV
ncbi:MAG: hypothetical protein NPIRA01_08870 [Nitrospirales bacterium]|nr:MAG: hypothetical protein NPIRA01_08870 [Nitrospirales bacterium]